MKIHYSKITYPVLFPDETVSEEDVIQLLWSLNDKTRETLQANPSIGLLKPATDSGDLIITLSEPSLVTSISKSKVLDIETSCRRSFTGTPVVELNSASMTLTTPAGSAPSPSLEILEANVDQPMFLAFSNDPAILDLSTSSEIKLAVYLPKEIFSGILKFQHRPKLFKLTLSQKAEQPWFYQHYPYNAGRASQTELVVTSTGNYSYKSDKDIISDLKETEKTCLFQLKIEQ